MTHQRRKERSPAGAAGPGRARYAALDLGTNNCRLLVAEAGRSGGLRIVDSYSQVVRLGEGLAASGRLSESAMERALVALSKCREKIAKTGASRVLGVATQACRAASNGKDFLHRVRQAVGLDVRLIGPKEEAKFALLGALDLIDGASDFALVLDIGGGSTELSWVDARTARQRGAEGCARRPPILGWASFPVGVVTLAESFDDAGSGWYGRMVDQVAEMFATHDAAQRFGPLFAAGRGHLIGNSGTVTCLSAVHLRLDRYSRAAVDGTWMRREDVEAARQRLHDATREERAAEPCVGSDRADLILSGCAILEAVLRLWPVERVRVGDRGLREGMILSMMYGPDNPAASGHGLRPRTRSSRRSGVSR